MELAAFSDRGIGTRERLEDYAADRTIITAGGLELQIALVCDGAGGGEAGELAARLTSRTIFEYLEISAETSVPQLLIHAVEKANKAVFDELRGTGTGTVAMAVVHLNDTSAPYGRLYVAHVGNSRIYLMREGRIVRLNIDHTLANEYIYAGQMSFEEAKQLDASEYVTRSIGIGAEVNVDIGFYAERGKDFVNSRRAFRIGQKGMKLQEGDTIFTASDGLFPYINDEEFLKHALDDNVERATRTLLKYAADRGPEDNIAISLVFVPSRNRKMVRTLERFSARQRAGIAIFAVAIALLIGFLGLQIAGGETQRVALLAEQTVVWATQESILQAATEGAYTPTPLPSPTPTLPPVAGQVGNRFSPSQQTGLAVFAGRYIDPLQPDEINYISIAGANALSSGQTVNQANFYLQPGSSFRLNQVIDTPGSEQIDLILKRGSDLFVNPGIFGSGGITIGLEQNPDIRLQSQNACMSVKQISADSTQPNDSDKVALTCYGGTCSYQFPSASSQAVPSGDQALLDVDNQQLISTSAIDAAQVREYSETIWQLSQREDQLSCLSNWLDEDSDTVNYPVDECPADAGSAAAKGCPDDDSDGVQNNVDQCVAEAGPESNNGCPLPDLDGDGLEGNDDLCPFNAGPAENDGCPTEGPQATERAVVLTQTAEFQVTATPSPTLTLTLTPSPTLTPTETPVPLPEADNDRYATLGNELLSIPEPGVLANDILNEALLLPFAGTTIAGGTISLNSDGSFDYLPPEDYVGLDSFEYTLEGVVGNDSATVTIEVLEPPADPPDAAFTVSPLSGPVGTFFTITNQSTGPINDYEWDFGDGSSSGSSNPEPHQYNQANTYTINLVVRGPGGEDPASQQIRVFDAPDAVDDLNVYAVQEDDLLTVSAENGVLANDVYENKSALTVSVIRDVEHGSLTLNANGGFTYDSDGNFNGEDSFTYQARDGAVTSDVALVTITINPENDAPTGQPDGFNTRFKTPLVIPAPGVLSNDSDIDSANLTAVLENGPSNDLVFSLNPNGSFNYTPNSTFTGDDTFTYHVSDGLRSSGTITVTITVGPNTPPEARDDDYTMPESSPTLSINSANGVLNNDVDVDSDPLTATLVSGPSNGTLPGGLNQDGSFTYQPDAGFTGVEDSFTYRARDPLTQSTNVATVTIRINRAPVADNDTYNVNEDTQLVVPAAGVLIGDTDANSGTTLTAALESLPTQGLLTLNANGGFTYDPFPNDSGTDTFEYRANDGSASSNVATVTINVIPVNDAPLALNDTYNTTLNTARTVNAAGGVLANDTDIDSATFTAVLVSGPTQGTLTTSPTNPTGLNLNGSFTYTPNTGFTGVDTFTYRVNDGAGSNNLSNIATVSIFVGVNTPPTADDDTYTMGGATLTRNAANGVLNGDNDPEGSALSAVLVGGPSNGLLTLDLDGGFTYTPTSGFVGIATFTYQANDGAASNNLSNIATVTITVGTNSIPDADADGTYTTQVNTLLDSTTTADPSVLDNDTDADNGPQPLTAFLWTNASNGSVLLNANGTFIYTPNLNYSGPDSFTYVAFDGMDISTETTVNINVTGVNAPPVAVDDTAYNTTFNSPLDSTTTGNPSVLGNDTDPDGDPLTAALQFGPSFGTVTLNANGTFIYIPSTGFFGQDFFYYQASDGNLVSNLATVVINVGVTPPIAGNDNYPTAVDTPLITTAPGVLANDTDPGGNSLTATLITPPTQGVLIFNFDGSFTYTPNAGYTGPDSFTYQAFNGFVSSNIATVNIDVGGIGGGNSPPVVNDNTYATSATRTLTINAPGVLRNDLDADGDTLTAILVTDVARGTLVLNSDGSFTYEPPNARFKGNVTFTYRANDGLQDSTTNATVTISVSVPPPKPVPIEVPAPPPATRCTDTNFENPGMIRSNFLDDVDRANLFCRLIAAGGSYMFWLGSPITNGGNIGNRSVIDLGLIAAVDVFSMSDVTQFVNDVNICLQGSGYIIYMNANGQPRVPQAWNAWTTPSFPGYTCTTLYAPGTVVLVANNPQ